MPELEFMFTDVEMDALVDHLLTIGLDFTPDIFDKPEPLVFKVREAIREYSVKRPLWHLRHKSYTMCPLEICRINRGFYKGMYSVAQRNGGPTIELGWSGEQEAHGRRFVGVGNIYYYPTFWNIVTHQNERAPAALRRMYQEIVKWIKSHSVPSENPISPRTGRPWPQVWIGNEAAIAWSKGLHLGPPSNESRRPRCVPH